MSYIDPRGKAFAHLDRLAVWQDGGKPSPVTVEWDLSNVCSLGCQFCHFAHTHVAGPWAAQATTKPDGYAQTGRFADVAVVERGLAEMAAIGVRAIVWSGGGEPTLHPAFTSIVQTAARFGLEQGLYTLGGHITPAVAAAVGPHLSWAVVSIDAADAASYAAEKAVPPSRFDDACKGLTALTETCPVVGASFLLHRGNYMQAWKMVARARELGATYATFRPTVQTSPDQPGVVQADTRWVADAPDFFAQLQNEPDVEIDPQRFRDYAGWDGHGYATCHGVKLLTMVTPDGRVWICPNRRGVAGSELGDLRTESFASIWGRHPGNYAVDAGCRAMCRLHLVNQTLATVYQPRQHEAFI